MNVSDFDFILRPKLLKAFHYLNIFFAFCLLLCFFTCRLDETVIAEGEIRPYTKETVVKCLFNGVVENVNYKDSDYVNKGDILFSLNSNYENEYLRNLLELELIYSTNLELLKEFLDLLEKTSEESLIYDERIMYDNSKYAAFVNSYKSYKNDYELKKNTFERQEFLFPKIISKQEYEKYENEYLQSYYVFITWLQNQKLEAREEYVNNCQNLEECKLKIIQIKKTLDNANCIATSSGYIQEIKNVKEGDFITDGTEILKILPKGDSLKCIVKIQNNYISKINIGQEAFIQIQDLPFIKYGKLKGKLSLISQDVVDSENPYYSVEINLDRNYLQNWKKEKVYLKIGTGVSVKIITDKNTIIQKIIQKSLCL